MPQCLSDCVLIPINKDSSCSQSYCLVALASSVSKVLELQSTPHISVLALYRAVLLPCVLVL